MEVCALRVTRFSKIYCRKNIAKTVALLHFMLCLNTLVSAHFHLGFPNRSNVALTTAKPKRVTSFQRIKDLMMKNFSQTLWGRYLPLCCREISPSDRARTRPEASVTNLNLRHREKLVNHLRSLSLYLTFIPCFHPFAVILSVYLQQRRNRRRKYRRYRSF